MWWRHDAFPVSDLRWDEKPNALRTTVRNDACSSTYSVQPSHPVWKCDGTIMLLLCQAGIPNQSTTPQAGTLQMINILTSIKNTNYTYAPVLWSVTLLPKHLKSSKNNSMGSSVEPHVHCYTHDGSDDQYGE